MNVKVYVRITFTFQTKCLLVINKINNFNSFSIIIVIIDYSKYNTIFVIF